MNILPVILAGGSGVRLWPLSRESTPKQLLPLIGERSLLQETILRARSDDFLAPVIICNAQYRFLIAEQIKELEIDDAEIVLEPIARNSAAAAAVAALVGERKDAKSVVLLLPSDHVIQEVDVFRRAVETAKAGAEAGYLMTFGINPTRPATEYGYIRAGAALPSAPACALVAKFVEKPIKADAERMLAEGGYAWNSGIFMFRPDAFMRELERHAPDIASAARGAVENSERDMDFLRLNAEWFAKSPSISVDYAVMEHTDRAAVCPLNADWSDLGSWSAVWDAAPQDAAQNVVKGDVLLEDVRGCLVRSEGALTAVLGIENAIIITTEDAVLVASKDRAQDVRRVVDQLKARNRNEHREGLTTHRPWGKYKSIGRGERHQVKLITVLPGASISLQLHHHRSEHWVVVGGTGKVTCGDKTFLLYENQSTVIPVGVRHRLENPGHIPLQIIEVQSGGYLGEDDIVRFDDRYGRTEGPSS